MTILLALALLTTLAFVVWLLILSIYGNHHSGVEWPEPECELCGDTPAFLYEECDQVLCGHHADYEKNYDQYWDGKGA